MKKFCSFVIAVLFFTVTGFSQLTGVKNIPGDYADLNAAITALTASGVGSGGVTINLLPGNPQTAPNGGYVISATGIAGNPIIFNGNGNTVTGVGSAALTDGVFKLNGADYVTLDGFSITTTDNSIEWGIALVKASSNNASQNNTIKNCIIDLDRTNISSVGIWIGQNTTTTTAIIPVTAFPGTNSFNKFYNNTITDCYTGYSLVNSNSINSPYDLYDQQNEINTIPGGAGSTITNFGGAALTAIGITTTGQNALKISNVNINGGAGSTGNVVGINVTNAVNASFEISYDTVSLTSSSNASPMQGFAISAGGSGYSNTVNVHHNLIRNCSYTTATTASQQSLSFSGSAANINIFENTITNNTHAGTGEYDCIFFNSALAANVLQADINNNHLFGNTRALSPTGTMTIISAICGVKLLRVYSNEIYNNTNPGAGLFNGIVPNNTSGVEARIYNNLIHDNLNGNAQFLGINELSGGQGGMLKSMFGNSIWANTSDGQMTGLSFVFGTNNYCYGNKIYDLQSNTTTLNVYGINIVGNINYDVNLYNNFISDLRSPVNINNNAVNGIICIGNGFINTKIYHNTVYLNPVSTGTNFGSSAFYLSGGPNTLELQNNIFVNTGTANGTGKTVAFYAGNPPMTTHLTLTSGNNCYYAGAPGVNNLLYYDGTNSAQTIEALRNAIPLREQHSFAELPPFVNIVTAPYDLHLNPATATACESGGVAVPAVTTDFDGNARNATTPDVGADEIAGTAIDVTGPEIKFTPIPNSDLVSLTLPAFATITDNAGVNNIAGTKPRIYYRRNTDANTYVDNTSATNGWKFTESADITSPYSFIIDYSKLFTTGAVTNGQTVQYFIVAQDLNGTPIVGNSSGIFTLKPASVALTAANFPMNGTLNSYVVTTNNYSGIIQVGTGQTITSITNANGLFDRLNRGLLTGNLTVQITSDLLTETNGISLKKYTEKGTGNYTVTVVPDGPTAHLIQGTSNPAVIILDGAQRFIIDGSFGGSGRYLTFRNSTLNAAVSFLGGSQHDTVRNCILETNNINGSGVGNGGVINITTPGSPLTTNTGNGYLAIMNNEIRDRSDVAGFNQYGVLCLGGGGIPQYYNHDNTISGNDIHDFWLDVANASPAGIFMATGNIYYTIVNNSFYQTTARNNTTNNTLRAIQVSQGSSNNDEGGHIIRGNMIGGAAVAFGTPSQYMVYGTTGPASTVTATFEAIRVQSGLIPTIIDSNIIKQIDFTTFSNQATAAFTGIVTTQGNITVNNNQIGAETGTDSIKITVNANTTVNLTTKMYMMFTANTGITGTTVFTNNRIGGITALGSANGPMNFFGLFVSGLIENAVSVQGNKIGSTVTANSINNNFLTANTFTGIRVNITNDKNISISGNSVSSLTDNGINTTNTLTGIFVSGNNAFANTSVISNNTVKNMVSLAQSTGGIFNLSGILLQSTASLTHTISNNTVADLSANNTGLNNWVSGILMSGAAQGGTVNANKVYNLSDASPGGAGRIYGIYSLAGAGWTVKNNSVSIKNTGNSNTLSVSGIADASLNNTPYSAYNNTVYIGGNVASGTLNSYAFSRESNALLSLRNNFFYNERTGTGKHYALANLYSPAPTDGWPATSSSYNTIIAANPATALLWASVDRTFAAWKTVSGGDLESYSVINAIVSSTTIFTDPSNNDFSVNVNVPECWYLNGKGIAGIAAGNNATDINTNPRNTTLGFPIDIGAEEFTPAAGVLPPDATPSAAPAAGTATSYNFGGRTLGTITWAPASIVPTAVTWKYYSGVRAPGLSGAIINSYHEVPATGSGTYSYLMDLYYTTAEQNQIPDASLGMMKKDGAAPYVNISSGSGSTASGKYIRGFALTTFSIFTLRDIFGVVPVKIEYFNGSKQNNSHVLDWKVSCGSTTHAILSLEISNDGVNFKTLHSSTETALRCQSPFSYINIAPPAGISYYRLRMEDDGGSIAYSGIVALDNGKKDLYLMNIAPDPVPVSGSFRLDIAAGEQTTINLIITDMNGRVAAAKTVSLAPGVNNIMMDTKGLAAGQYTVTGHTAKGAAGTLRFIVQ